MSNLTGEWYNGKVYPTQESPAGIQNGVNRVFTLAGPPMPGSLAMFLNGLYLTPVVDYTLVEGSATVTMTSAPALTDNLRAQYLK